jgi:hypothetical protein
MFFEMIDDTPYTSGWFGFRTVRNHMAIDNFRVTRLSKNLPASEEPASSVQTKPPKKRVEGERARQESAKKRQPPSRMKA